MIDIESVHSSDAGTRFHQAVATLLGIIAVLAAVLGAVQLDRSQDGARASTMAARLTADVAAGVPIQGIATHLTYQGFQDAITRSAEGTARQLVAGDSDPAAAAEGAAEVAAGDRLMDVASAMGAPPDATTGMPAYELRLLTADMTALAEEVKEQNRVVDVDIHDAGADSNAAVAGLSVLALAGVLVGLASVLGADGAGRTILVVAWAAAGAATILLITTLW